MSYERLRPTFTFDAERLEQLKAIAPEAFADGKINWEALRAALGEHLEEEGADAEHFGLFWPGKRAARRRASEPSRGTLIPVPGAGVNEETTRNIFIEADNLDALKLLQKAYAGRVKMIYIDPPYNTGNDFIYRDDFRETSEDYLRRTGQVDEFLRPLTTNPRTGGRFHSTWLNMMYPRLLLARTLLREDGVIFVSIDDNEVANLRLMMDEIFGPENFVACIIWEKRSGPPNDKVIGSVHEYILVFALATSSITLNLLPRSSENLERFSNPDNDPRGEWAPGDLSANAKGGRYVASLYFEIENPVTKKRHLPPDGACWRFSKETVEAYIREGRIYFGMDNLGRPKIKRYLSEVRAGMTVPTVWTDLATNAHARSEIRDYFEDGNIFETPKPLGLLRRITSITTMPSEQHIILDFFAGSGTTAHAVMAQNAEDGGNRQFILVQLPEPTGRADFPTIADIAAERIRRAGKKIAEERAAKLPEPDAAPLDIGFRYYRFAPSNYKAWRDYEGDDLAQLQTLFDRFETPLVDGWQPDHLLTEVMLQLGFPLDSRIEALPDFTANAVRRVTSDFHAHALYVCFDAAVADETIAALSLNDEDIFVCLDSALTDQTKARLSDVCNLRTI
jgi:adenine-specific DNA-methyltransferase